MALFDPSPGTPACAPARMASSSIRPSQSFPLPSERRHDQKSGNESSGQDFRSTRPSLAVNYMAHVADSQRFLLQGPLFSKTSARADSQKRRSPVPFRIASRARKREGWVCWRFLARTRLCPLLRERLFRYGVPTHEEELAMKLRGLFIAAAVLLMPTAALAAPGIVTTTVSLRAGPGEGFPTVDRIPGGDRVNIHGCLRGTAWCDVSWSDDRGWVSSQYLEYLYRNRYVYLPDYVDEIDVPVVPFVLTSYWSSYYAGRPWYQRRAYWSGYWQSHERFATRLTIDRLAARIGRAAAARDAALPEAKARVGVEEKSRARVEERTRAGVTERTRAGVTERVTREKDIATRSAREGHERAAVQARMTRENARMTRENARAAVREQPRHEQ